jgi:hypothetical protein
MDPTHGEAARTERRVRSATVTFYRWHNVMITDRLLVVGHREYLLSSLSDIQVGRGPLDRTARLLAIATATAAVGFVLIGWRLTADGLFGAGALLAAMGGGLGYRLRTRPREHELHAEYHGGMVLLLTERDTLRFGQICRALGRAREHRRALA